MATQAELNFVERLLNLQYGLNLGDVDQDRIERDLDEGEDPQAIVDDIAEKHGLERIDRMDGTTGWNSRN